MLRYKNSQSIIMYLLYALLEKPIEKQYKSIGDSIVERNNKLLGTNYEGFRHKKFVYNEGYQHPIHPDLIQNVIAMQEWRDDMDNHLYNVQPLLKALSENEIGSNTINYFIPSADLKSNLIEDSIAKKQIESIQSKYEKELESLNILNIGTLLT